MRTVVVGASSGLGRCIGVGLAQRGAHTALLARRQERLDAAAKEAGNETVALSCDVTDSASCVQAIEEVVKHFGGIDALVYTPAIGPLVGLADTDAATWRRVFDTNVIGASLVTAAALPYLLESGGTAIYLSSVSASLTPPWPGLGAYAVSKAALDKLVEAWRVEHPTIGFTRMVVGDCVGGEGDGATGFADQWDPDLMMQFHSQWMAGNYLAGAFVDVADLVAIIDSLLRQGGALSLPSVTIAPRLTGAPA